MDYKIAQIVNLMDSTMVGLKRKFEKAPNATYRISGGPQNGSNRKFDGPLNDSNRKFGTFDGPQNN